MSDTEYQNYQIRSITSSLSLGNGFSDGGVWNGREDITLEGLLTLHDTHFHKLNDGHGYYYFLHMSRISHKYYFVHLVWLVILLVTYNYYNILTLKTEV